jgi:nucleoid-associated protein YgaU
MKIWTVAEGDTLWTVAEEEYGDTSHWRTIAEANDIKNPRQLESGTKLSLPPL